MLGLALPAGSEAAPATIGQLPESPPVPGCATGPRDFFQLTPNNGDAYRVPLGYTEIVSWSTYASEGEGQVLELKVFDDHLPSGQYAVIRHDQPRTLTPSAINTFPVEISVAPGDIIGLDDVNASPELPSGCVFPYEAADTFAFSLNSALGDGEGGTYKVEKLGRVNAIAVVEAPPAVDLIGPSRGPASGGTTVVIAGHDLTAAKRVSFGDGAIAAVSPPSSPRTVDVTVTTAAGTTPKSAPDRFTYDAPSAEVPRGERPTSNCIVPRLHGRLLAAVRRKLKAAHCRPGKITGPRGRRARVRRQSVKPGTVLPSGASVAVRLGAA
jgi:hypothetical protein